MNNQTEQPLLLNFQRVLEHNEDIIAAIVENMQLGRMEDCINHYMILQSNLVSLGCELDNYPAGESDLYEEAYSFPDEIMRKDVLDDLLPHKSRVLPKPPLAPPCWKCASQNLSAEICRIQLDHIDPSSKFTQGELEEFFHSAEVLTSRYKQQSIESLPKRAGGSSGKGGAETQHQQKKSYKLSSAGRHSVLLAVSVLKTRDAGRISQVLGEECDGRVVHSFLSSKAGESVLQDALNGKLPQAPKGYEPPATLVNYLQKLHKGSAGAGAGSSGMPSSLPSGHNGSGHGGYDFVARQGALTEPLTPQSCLAPKRGSHDWRSLLEMATANSLQDKPGGSGGASGLPGAAPRLPARVPDLDELHALIKSTSARRYDNAPKDGGGGRGGGSATGVGVPLGVGMGGFDPRTGFPIHPMAMTSPGLGMYNPYFGPGLGPVGPGTGLPPGFTSAHHYAQAQAQAHYAHAMSMASRGVGVPNIYLAPEAPLMPALFGLGFMGVPLPTPPPPHLGSALAVGKGRGNTSTTAAVAAAGNNANYPQQAATSSGSATVGTASNSSSNNSNNSNNSNSNRPESQPPPFARAGFARLQQQKELERKWLQEAAQNHVPYPYLNYSYADMGVAQQQRQEYLQEQWEQHRKIRGMTRQRGGGSTRSRSRAAATAATATSATSATALVPVSETTTAVAGGVGRDRGKGDANGGMVSAPAVGGAPRSSSSSTTAYSPAPVGMNTGINATATATKTSTTAANNVPPVAAQTVCLSSSSSLLSGGISQQQQTSSSAGTSSKIRTAAAGSSGAGTASSTVHTNIPPAVPVPIQSVRSYGTVVIGDDDKVSEDEIADSDDDDDDDGNGEEEDG